MFTAEFQKTGARIHSARLISFVGSAFTEFAIPLFLFHHANNPVHVGFQWVLVALTKLVAGQLASKFSLGRSDKWALVNIDVLLAMTILLPLIFWKLGFILVGAYLCTFLSGFLVTLQAGYIDSLVGHAAEKEENPEAARSWLLSKIENGRHVGMLFGYVLAYSVASGFGYDWAFAIDAASFLLSAALFSTVAIEGQPKLAARPVAAYQILFRPATRILTLTQLLVGFGLFTYNAAYILFLKRDLAVSDGVITLLLIGQYMGYVVGSFIPGWWVRRHRKPLPDSFVLVMRSLAVPVFIAFACAPNGLWFVVVNALFSLIIASQLPGSVALFQKLVSSSELRAAGAARIAVTSFAGAFGAATASFVLNRSSGRVVFAYGAVVYLIAAILLWTHLSKQRSVAQQAA